MHKFYFVVFLFIFHHAQSQNTIGVIKNDSDAYNAYTLFTSATETYLINNCGQVVHQWSSDYNPGNSVYLLENGNLLRACKVNNTDIVLVVPEVE